MEITFEDPPAAAARRAPAWTVGAALVASVALVGGIVWATGGSAPTRTLGSQAQPSLACGLVFVTEDSVEPPDSDAPDLVASPPASLSSALPAGGGPSANSLPYVSGEPEVSQVLAPSAAASTRATPPPVALPPATDAPTDVPVPGPSSGCLPGPACVAGGPETPVGESAVAGPEPSCSATTVYSGCYLPLRGVVNGGPGGVITAPSAVTTTGATTTTYPAEPAPETAPGLPAGCAPPVPVEVPGPVPSEAPGSTACTAADVTVSLGTDATSYAAGHPVELATTLTNTSTTVCTLTGGSSLVDAYVTTPAGELVWEVACSGVVHPGSDVTEPCPAVASVEPLLPGVPFTVTDVWDQRYGGPRAPGTVPAGSYLVTVAAAGTSAQTSVDLRR